MTQEEKQRQRLQDKGLDSAEIERRLKGTYGDKYVGTGVNKGQEFEGSPDSFVDFVRNNATIANPDTQLGVQRALTGANKSTGDTALDAIFKNINLPKAPNIDWLKKLFTGSSLKKRIQFSDVIEDRARKAKENG